MAKELFGWEKHGNSKEVRWNCIPQRRDDKPRNGKGKQRLETALELRRLAANGSEKEWLSPDLIGNRNALIRTALERRRPATRGSGDE